MTKNSTIREVEKLEAAMEERPPVITWRLDPIRRVQVMWTIDDPYAETTVEAQAGRLRGSAARAERQHAVDEAREVAKRSRKHRAENTPLLAAARTEI